MMTEPKMLPISKARDASKRLGLKSMIVLQELPDGRWGYTSYGRTKAECTRARNIADELLGQAVYAAEVEDGEI